MATTKVTFEFPSDAWPGIVAALAERRKEDDPLTAEQYAIQQVKEFVAVKFADYVKRAKQAETDAYIASRIPQVNAATTATIEVVE